jgi:predicted transcriptional regulator
MERGQTGHPVSVTAIVEMKETIMPTVQASSQTPSIPSVFALDKALQARLTALAVASRQQPGQLLEEAVREYVERQEYRNAQALDALKAWKQFEASGRKNGISLDEMTPWLDSWGTDNELPPPVSIVKTG